MKAIRHFGIVVTDIKKSLKFYRDFLGLKIRRDMLEKGEFIDKILGIKDIEVRTVKMAAEKGDTLVELLYFKRPSFKKKIKRKIFDIGPSHLSLTTENIDKLYKKLKKQGVKFNCSPQVSPNGKAKVTFCYDPDGAPIELVEEI